MGKKKKLYIGIGDDLKEVEANVPEGTPVPWDGKDKLKEIGGYLPRVDGPDKVSGEAEYTFDVQLPGMLHARFLRSPYPAARVTKLDLSKVRKAPGVRAITVVKGKVPFDLRYQGEEILAIAADTPEEAQAALEKVDIEYKKRKFVVDLESARDETSPQVYRKKVKNRRRGKRKGNVMGPSADGNREETEKALKSSEVTIKATYKSQVQTHSALETHGAVAHWDGDQLTVWISTQGTFSVLSDLARKFRLPRSKIRVITHFMGGGFGAKFGAGIYGTTAADLSRKAGAPVRLMLNRKEEHLAGGNRPNSHQEIELGADKKGKLQAMKLIAYGSSGVAGGGGRMVSRPMKFIYQCENKYAEEWHVFMNSSPGCAFRAPGHPQGVFALDQAMDEMAYKLGIDPLEFRKINSSHHQVRMKEYELGAKKFGWDKRNPKVAADSGPIKRGVGMANSVWYYFNSGGQVEIQVNGDGSVVMTNGVQDIGTGIRTVMAQVVAEELGLKAEDIDTRIGDTSYGVGPASGGSKTTSSITPAARNAAYQARKKMVRLAAKMLKAQADEIEVGDGKFYVKKEPSRSKTFKEVARRISGGKFIAIGDRPQDSRSVQLTTAGVQFAEVEVDTETGVVEVKRVVAAHDCGRVMNRLTTESQINGGIIQGISYALFEDRILDRNTGIMVNPNLEQYKIAGALDMPLIESIMLDVHHGQNATGAIGIGEPTTVPTAAAIANAVYHATGARVREIPMTPARVLKAIEEAKQGGGK